MLGYVENIEIASLRCLTDRRRECRTTGTASPDMKRGLSAANISGRHNMSLYRMCGHQSICAAFHRKSRMYQITHTGSLPPISSRRISESRMPRCCASETRGTYISDNSTPIGHRVDASPRPS
ncbi:hypothetical protein CY34DRAFT_577293 [Suillus luteus UH-Slu-Lm8-n1]|uniref:Uncharacterized protein n=1 Tax=Suillus luteus UH-Slu-Lm8-n1 TaxID=930992 RepID=A0A0D0BSK1_9AGAM|nr:hypothetical protein CY34DRAFT_577293 [Suillus luteus UH-Slu-Lm8-n1]